jgi:signal peptidase I
MVFFHRTLAFLILLSGASLAAGHGENRHMAEARWVRGIYVAPTPLCLHVPESIAQSVANARAREVRGMALHGYGTSMQPIYREGVIMIVAPVPYEDLQRGQIVVYKNSRGHNVAHVLVAKCRTGWRVTGINNRTHDREGVTADNLQGLVVDAILPSPSVEVAVR